MRCWEEREEWSCWLRRFRCCVSDDVDEDETTICGLPDYVGMIRTERERREEKKLKDEKRSEVWDLK